ncbi:MAG: lipopolysaccharide biosynthesis protein [Bacteriovoracia bacterium]
MISLTSRKLSVLLFLIASFMQSGFYWFLTILISRKFGIEALGSFSYALAIVSPLTILGSLQLKSYFLTKGEGEIKGQIKWLRFSFLTGLLTISSSVIAFIEPWLLPVFILLCLLKWGELWSELSQMIWQSESGLRIVNRSLFIRYALLFTGLAIVWSMDFDIIKTLSLVALISLGIAGVDYFLSPLKRIAFKVRESGTVFITTLSLSASSLLTALLVNIPRYQLKEIKSLEDLGMFSILFYYYVIPAMVINYACQGLLKDFRGVRKNRNFFLKITGGLAALSLIFFLFLFFLGESFTLLLYNKQPEWDLTIVLLITLAFFLGGTASVLHYSLMGAGIYDIQLKTNIISCAVTLVTGFFTIPSLGVTGAFISFISGIMIQAFVYAFLFKRLKYE